jgi:hypothetical protein
MLRLKGELLLMRDGRATEEAEDCFRRALDVARAQEGQMVGAAHNRQPRRLLTN